MGMGYMEACNDFGEVHILPNQGRLYVYIYIYTNVGRAQAQKKQESIVALTGTDFPAVLILPHPNRKDLPSPRLCLPSR